MVGNLKLIIFAGIALFVGYNFFYGTSTAPQSADLGQVLDRSVFALDKYNDHLTKNNVTEAGEKE